MDERAGGVGWKVVVIVVGDSGALDVTLVVYEVGLRA
jgi:hypothetical protein